MFDASLEGPCSDDDNSVDGGGSDEPAAPVYDYLPDNFGEPAGGGNLARYTSALDALVSVYGVFLKRY